MSGLAVMERSPEARTAEDAAVEVRHVAEVLANMADRPAIGQGEKR